MLNICVGGGERGAHQGKQQGRQKQNDNVVKQHGKQKLKEVGEGENKHYNMIRMKLLRIQMDDIEY